MTPLRLIDLTPAPATGATPLILLHAFPIDHQMWEPVAERLADRRIQAVDLPGMGQSPVGSEPAGLEESADAVAAALTGAGLRRVVVAGLSMGGYVALTLAERHPELLAGLGLLDTKSTADPAAARDNRLRIAQEVTGAGNLDAVAGMADTLLGETTRVQRPDVEKAVRGWMSQQTPAGVAWSQRAMAARPDRTHVIAGFDGPVLVLVGDEDTTAPLAEAQHMADAARDARLVTVPGSGHLSAIECPDTVAAALADLLDRVDH